MAEPDWGFVSLWQQIAGHHPDRLALMHGDRRYTWSDMHRSIRMASHGMLGAGVQAGDIVVVCLRNCPEYLITFAAALSIGATPANVNYRYRHSELHQLLALLQPTAVIHAETDAATFAALRPTIPTVRVWRAVNPDTGQHKDILTSQDVPPDNSRGVTDTLQRHRSAEIIKCTGGTTGMPSAVRWSAATMFAHLNDHNPWLHHETSYPLADTTPPVVNARVVLASPLMHGSALTRALGALCAGGTVITTQHPGFQPEEVVQAVHAHAADTLAITGDAHAVPLIKFLSGFPRRSPLDGLRVITSSGAVWRDSLKRSLIELLPQVRLVETLGATEATGLGFSTARYGSIPDTGVFSFGRHARALRRDGSVAQVGERALIGVSEPLPAGLHPNHPLSAERFLHHDGTAYLLSGDHVRVLDDDRFLFLGRNEDCINTGGEKVYAPEVAEVLLTHPAVTDVAVFSMPHPRLGEAVTALIAGRLTGTCQPV
jgi:3-oxocholest-4-en-26-oate---CoA ligase